MLSRFAIYFDEVARAGSIRKASERLNIAASAIDRHILRMEEKLGTALFERRPQGLRLTAAGEVLIGVVRNWRRELRNAESQLDALKGLRRGEISLAVVEGSAAFVTRSLAAFSRVYPGIVYHLRMAMSAQITDLVLAGEVDFGICFNPPARHDIRVERALVYQLGAVVLPDHPIATQAEIALSQCVDHTLVGPTEGNALREILDRAWASSVGAPPRFVATASTISLIKSLVLNGVGIGFLTPIDVAEEVASGRLCLVPIGSPAFELSALSLITAAGRPSSTAASLLIQHLGGAMAAEPGRVI